MGILSGHTALITGSTQGVGAAIALAVAEAGAQVIVHGLREDAAAESICEKLEGQGKLVGAIYADLAEPLPGCVQQVFETAVQLAPNIDLLVNNAGGYFDRPFLEMSFEAFDRTMKLNVYSGFLLTQLFARKWAEKHEGGRILFVGSINGRLAETTHAAYDTSKGAVEMMVKTLCVSLAPYGIRVNGIAPGLFVTPLTAPALADPRLLHWMEVHTPNGRVPGPDACAGAAVFLLSDSAEHIQGHMLMVDGGMSVWQQPDPVEEI